MSCTCFSKNDSKTEKKSVHSRVVFHTCDIIHLPKKILLVAIIYIHLTFWVFQSATKYQLFFLKFEDVPKLHNEIRISIGRFMLKHVCIIEEI